MLQETAMTDFFRFPHTPHLTWLGSGTPRDDKILTSTEVEQFLANPVTVEEKVDGANLGISFDNHGNLRIQNRGGYLSAPWNGQFGKLEKWLDPRIDELFDALQNRLTLFGEWCAVVHSLKYSAMPDWFIGFDIYDKSTGRFFSRNRRDDLLNLLAISTVPCLASGQFNLEELKQLLTVSRSAYRNGPPEGIYLRQDCGDWLIGRAKLVRPEFVQAITEHWRRKLPEPNQLAL